MHLAANSIDNLIEHLAKSVGIEVKETAIYTLTCFLDEHVSHYVWHLAIVGLAVLLVAHEWRRPAGEGTAWGTSIAGGIIYGVACCIFFVEGQRVPLGLPFVAPVTLFGLLWGGGSSESSRCWPSSAGVAEGASEGEACGCRRRLAPTRRAARAGGRRGGRERQ